MSNTKILIVSINQVPGVEEIQYQVVDLSWQDRLADTIDELYNGDVDEGSFEDFVEAIRVVEYGFEHRINTLFEKVNEILSQSTVVESYIFGVSDKIANCYIVIEDPDNVAGDVDQSYEFI